MLTRRIFKYLFRTTVFSILSFYSLSGCADSPIPFKEYEESPVPIVSSTVISEEIRPTVTPSGTPKKTSSPIPVITATPTFDQPAGCKKPVENYGLVEINGMQINLRTFEMLQNAQNSLWRGNRSNRLSSHPGFVQQYGFSQFWHARWRRCC